MLEKYESKQQQIRRTAETIYRVVSDFTNFSPVLADRVEGWQATADECSFRVKGFEVRLLIVDKEEPKMVKIKVVDGGPLDATFWIQLLEVAPYDTRMRLVLYAEMNMMIKMMVGKKLQPMLDQMAEKIAQVFNAAY